MSTFPLTGQVEELLGQRVRGSGVNGAFLCPFHSDRSASFSIHLIDGVWQCFGCGRKGTLERLYQLMGEEISEESRHDLLIRSLDREPSSRINFAPLANHFRRSFAGRAGQDAWYSFTRERPITHNAASAFGVGWNAEKSALAFPYWQSDGTVSAIKYRHSDGSKTSESGSRRTLYNVPDIEGAGTVIVCEGESDTLSTWSCGIEGLGVCGSPGAGVSEGTWAQWGLHLLFARRIYVAFDADEAGDKGAETAMRVLGVERCVRIRPTKGKDITEHLMNGGTFDELLEERYDQPV